MTDSDIAWIIFWLTTISWAVYYFRKIKETQYNAELKSNLERKKASVNYFLEVEKNKITQQKKELHERTAVVKDMIDDASEQYRRAKAEKEYALSLNQEFNKSFISGRKWLADFIAEADKKMDDLVVRDLRYKKRPAVTASIEVADAQKQKREAIKKVKYLEYQIKTYKEHFPFLDEYEDLILNNEIDIITEEQDLPDSLNEIDRARLYLSAEEFGSLPTYERNQLALNRFLSKNHSKLMIGRMYERYIGYIYEQLGYEVEYHGIIKKFEDLGRDLICKKQNEILIIQAKCWSKSKTIHEKHIFRQIFRCLKGSTHHKSGSDLISDIFQIPETLLSVSST